MQTGNKKGLGSGANFSFLRMITGGKLPFVKKSKAEEQSKVFKFTKDELKNIANPEKKVETILGATFEKAMRYTLQKPLCRRLCYVYDQDKKMTGFIVIQSIEPGTIFLDAEVQKVLAGVVVDEEVIQTTIQAQREVFIKKHSA